MKVRVALGMRPVLEKHLGWDPATIGAEVVGLAVGGKGELYVLDSDSRMKVFDAGGKYLRTIMPYPADLPRERVESMGQLEIEGGRVPVVYSAHYGTFHPLMSGLKHRTMAFSPKGFLLMTTGVGTKEEHGMPRHLAAIVNEAGLLRPQYLAVDPARGRLYVRQRDPVFLHRWYFRIDLADGKLSRLRLDPKQGPVIATDRDGNLYVGPDFATDWACRRYDPEGKPLPFASLGTNQIPGDRGNPHWSRGIAVAPDGTMYVLRNLVRHRAGQLDVYGPDGALRKSDLITGLDRASCGLGVDAVGNVYIGTNVKLKEQPYPPEVMGKVPAQGWWFWYPGKYFGDRPEPWTGTYYNPYLYHWGSILKFGPAGGGFHGLRPRPDKGKDPDPLADVAGAPADARSFQNAMLEREVRIAGLQWARHGYGIVASQDCAWGDPGCCCSTSGFAVDPYGRVFHPDPFRFRIEALDTGGNRLARFGRYGNPDASAAAPDAVFAWPAFVAFAADRICVSDAVNQRITVIRLDHAASAECAIR